ncbi:MAG TPA: sulfite exporter TauE/SafE family protein [Bacteroidota bacterium]
MLSSHFDIFHAAVLVIAGCIAGLMNSIAGGGTLVTFPALIYTGLPSIDANATSTVALLPATLGGTIGYRNKIRNILPWLKLFVPVSLLGGLIGGILLVQTPSRMFDAMVPFLILFATILFMAQASFNQIFGIRTVQAHNAAPSRKWIYGSVLFQFFVAVYGGYFGAGIGILMLASLGMLGFEDIHEMNTLKVILGFLINVVAAVYFIISGLIHWPDAFVMACGTVIGGYGGAHYAQKVPQKKVRTAITLIGLAISAVMFWRQFS